MYTNCILMQIFQCFSKFLYVVMCCLIRLMFYVVLIYHLCLMLQQLMRERQQMASRPFASVAVALDARGEQTEMLQPVVDVSPVLVCLHIHEDKVMSSSISFILYYFISSS